MVINPNFNWQLLLFDLLLGMLSLRIIICNATVVIKHIKKIAPSESETVYPLLGGILGYIVLLVTVQEPSWLHIIPLFLDYGCIPLLCSFIYSIISSGIISNSIMEMIKNIKNKKK